MLDTVPLPLLKVTAIFALLGALGCSSARTATVSAGAAAHEECAEHKSCETPVAKPERGTVLNPWEPVDEDYRGCEGACGTRATAASPDTTPQPGAAVGQLTYCLVSGVTIPVKEAGPRRVVNGALVYFCCEACAVYFSEHETTVSRARGLVAR